MPQKTEVVRVNGRNGADAFQMAPNSSALLLDASEPIVWLAQTDGAGYKTISAYDISPHQPDVPVDVKGLEARIANIESIVSRWEDRNGKSNNRNYESKQNGGSSSKYESGQANVS